MEKPTHIELHISVVDFSWGVSGRGSVTVQASLNVCATRSSLLLVRELAFFQTLSGLPQRLHMYVKKTSLGVPRVGPRVRLTGAGLLLLQIRTRWTPWATLLRRKSARKERERNATKVFWDDTKRGEKGRRIMSWLEASQTRRRRWNSVQREVQAGLAELKTVSLGQKWKLLSDSNCSVFAFMSSKLADVGFASTPVFSHKLNLVNLQTVGVLYTCKYNRLTPFSSRWRNVRADVFWQQNKGEQV